MEEQKKNSEEIKKLFENLDTNKDGKQLLEKVEITQSIENQNSQEKKEDVANKIKFLKESKQIYDEKSINSSKLATKWLEIQRKQQEEKDQKILVDLKRKRVDFAANWMDKEIKKLIAHLKKNGKPPHYEITFGKLFQLAEDNMEALSGILKLGKKAGAVTYESKNEILMQGRDDNVIISLLNENFNETEKKYTEIEQKEHKSLIMEAEELKNLKLGDVKTICNICKKKVLPNEEVSGLSMMGSIVLHQECFRCKVCQQKLSVGSFSELNGKYYCIEHYKSLFMKNTNYDFDEKK